MQVILVRHGAAENFEIGASRLDSDRQLTQEGRIQMKQVAMGLRRIIGNVDVIATSPYIRAVQTAEILSEGLDETHPTDIQRIDALKSGTDPETMTEWLATQGPEATIMLVGHEPDFSILLAYLTTNDCGSYAKFSKGGVCLVECASTPAVSKGRLIWLVTPSILK